MPIDPSIILAGRPMPQIDLLGNVAAVQQLRGMIEAQRLNELQRQQGILSLEGQREAIARTRALNEALSANPNLTDQQLFQLGGTAAFPIVKQRYELENRNAETNRIKADTDLKQLQAASEATDRATKMLRAVKNQDGYNSWARVYGKMLTNAGVIVPPAYNPEWVNDTVGMGMSLKEKLDADIRAKQEDRDAQVFAYKLQQAQNAAEAGKLNERGLTREKEADLQRAQQDRDAADARAAKNRDVQMRGQNMADARAREALSATQNKPQSSETARTAEAAQSGIKSVDELINGFKQKGYKWSVTKINTETDRDLVRAKNNVVDVIGRLRTGAAMTTDERKRFESLAATTMADLVSGDEAGAVRSLNRLKGEFQGVLSRVQRSDNAGTSLDSQPRREKWEMRNGKLVKVN